jgi:predicted MFS family arabinose efflux permease
VSSPARSEWGAFGAYAAVAASNQALWLTFAPITTVTARAYHVSDSAVGLLANVFPLIFVFLSLPCGRLLDRRFGPALGLGTVLGAIGALVRIPGHSYAVLLAGQLLIAIAQPFILNAITAMSVRHLLPEDRSRGIALGSAAMFLGMVAALALGAVTTASRLHGLLVIEAVVAVATAVWLCVALSAGQTTESAPVAVASGVLRLMWLLPAMRRLCALVFLGFGVFVALTTWLQTLVAHAGIGSSTASGLLVAMVVAGAVGSAVLAPLAIARGRVREFLGVSALVTALACVCLATGPGVAISAAAVTATGLVLLADLPILLQAAEDVAGVDAATATAMIWLAGNAGGIVLALVVQGLLDWPWLAFGAMAAAVCLALPLVGEPRRVAIKVAVAEDV